VKGIYNDRGTFGLFCEFPHFTTYGRMTECSLIEKGKNNFLRETFLEPD
jgi:hypothetical protein